MKIFILMFLISVSTTLFASQKLSPKEEMMLRHSTDMMLENFLSETENLQSYKILSLDRNFSNDGSYVVISLKYEIPNVGTKIIKADCFRYGGISCTFTYP